MEIIVSMSIIFLILLGLANLFVAGKRHILHSRSRMVSAELGKVFLDPLQMQVRQDQWGSNCLSSNPTAGCPRNATIDNMRYNATYRISDLGLGQLRKVNLTVSWNETNP